MTAQLDGFGPTPEPVLCKERPRDLAHAVSTTLSGHAVEALLACQQADGHWVFETEADATMPADYVLLGHYLGEIDAVRERAFGIYLRGGRRADGGWPCSMAATSTSAPRSKPTSR